MEYEAKNHYRTNLEETIVGERSRRSVKIESGPIECHSVEAQSLFVRQSRFATLAFLSNPDKATRPGNDPFWVRPDIRFEG
jgi:hypothetical protein